MKAATGELNLTVITIVAISAVIFFFSTILWPKIQASINTQWENVNTTSPVVGDPSSSGDEG